MPASEAATRQVFAELQAGDRLEVIHEVKVGLTRWPTKTIGEVVKTERRRQGLHFNRSLDDKVFADVIVLRLPDGSLTTVTVDEFTELRRI